MICLFLIIIDYIYSLQYKYLIPKRTIFYASPRFNIKKYELCNETIFKQNITENIINKEIHTNDADLLDNFLLNKEKIMELKRNNKQLYDYYMFINNK
jgi:hypothetical protein